MTYHPSHRSGSRPVFGTFYREEYEGNWTPEPWNGTGVCAACEHNGDVHRIAGVCMVTGCECDLWVSPAATPEEGTG